MPPEQDHNIIIPACCLLPQKLQAKDKGSNSDSRTHALPNIYFYDISNLNCFSAMDRYLIYRDEICNNIKAKDHEIKSGCYLIRIKSQLRPRSDKEAVVMGDWRGGDTELSSLLARPFASRTNLFADVSLVCEENRIVPAHKLVLAVTSQYFQVVYKSSSRYVPSFIFNPKGHSLSTDILFSR